MAAFARRSGTTFHRSVLAGESHPGLACINAIAEPGFARRCFSACLGYIISRRRACQHPHSEPEHFEQVPV
eukprot:5712713-Alexandrium_andersonii.AAC.1